jgi:hypothetical protein
MGTSPTVGEREASHPNRLVLQSASQPKRRSWDDFSENGAEQQLELCRPLLFELLERKRPLLRLATVRSAVVRRVRSEDAYRARLILGACSAVPGLWGLWALWRTSRCEAKVLEYRIVIDFKRSKDLNRFASRGDGFCLRLLGHALDLRFQLSVRGLGQPASRCRGRSGALRFRRGSPTPARLRPLRPPMFDYPRKTSSGRDAHASP